MWKDHGRWRDAGIEANLAPVDCSDVAIVKETREGGSTAPAESTTRVEPPAASYRDRLSLSRLRPAAADSRSNIIPSLVPIRRASASLMAMGQSRHIAEWKYSGRFCFAVLFALVRRLVADDRSEYWHWQERPPTNQKPSFSRVTSCSAFLLKPTRPHHHNSQPGLHAIFSPCTRD